MSTPTFLGTSRSPKARESSTHPGSQSRDPSTSHKKRRLEPKLSIAQFQGNHHHIPLAQPRWEPVLPHTIGYNCNQLVMSYIYLCQQRPADNDITFWENVVMEYFLSGTKMKWCFGCCHDAGGLPDGVSNCHHPETVVDRCPVCFKTPWKGYAANYEDLPRFYQNKFEHGAIYDVLLLETPRQLIHNSEILVLDYPKATQQSIYEHQCIVRVGQLRIAFVNNKIMAWDFCIQSQKYFSMVTPQAIQLMRITQKYQTALDENGRVALSTQELQTFCNTFVEAVHQLEKSLAPMSTNDLCFSIAFAQSQQSSQASNMTSQSFNSIPHHEIETEESRKNYPRAPACPQVQQTAMMGHGTS